MSPEAAVELLKMLMIQAVILAAPVLGASMIIGLIVSLFQAVTSIHEQTLTFVPKALGAIGVLIMVLPWLVRTVTDFTIDIFSRIPLMVQ
jgi:flagellar biosynthetic protein FliQ